MKKLGILLLVLVFSQCQVKIEPKTASADEIPRYNLNTIRHGNRGYLDVSVYNRDGIEYRVFTSTGYYGNGGVHVINHTKEKLEIELLRAQLLELKKINDGN